MPFKSLRQERYFNANRSKLEGQGVDIGEWNAASKGLSLPEQASPQKKNSSSAFSTSHAMGGVMPSVHRPKAPTALPEDEGLGPGMSPGAAPDRAPKGLAGLKARRRMAP